MSASPEVRRHIKRFNHPAATSHRIAAQLHGRHDRPPGRLQRDARADHACRLAWRGSRALARGHGRIAESFAMLFGLEAHPERCIMAQGGRHTPDLVVGNEDGPIFVIEVKSSLESASTLRAALSQVRRYRRVVGGGEPIITAHHVPVASIAEVRVLSVADLVEEMRQLTRSAVA